MSARLLLGPEAPREAWLAARLPGITASEIAAVLGISPFESPFSLYWRKQGELADIPDNDTLSLGRHLEPWIADRYEADHPEVTLTLSGLYASAERPWQLCTPDREVWPTEGGTYTNVYDRTMPWAQADGQPPTRLWEGKTSATYDGWGDAGTDDIPAYYRAQTLWQSDVFGRVPVDLSCLFLHTKQVRHYRIEWQEADVLFMREQAQTFRRRVAAGMVPPIDGHRATTAALKAIHPDIDADAEVELPDTLASSYRQIKAMKKRMEAREDLIENRVRAALGRAKTANDADGKKVASRSVFDQTRVDVKTLRALYPEVYAACARKATTDKLNPSRTKKDAA